MLRHRLWMGAVLVALVVGMLVLDGDLAPWYPFLLVFVVGLGLAACFELLHLLNPTQRPYAWLCFPLVAGLLLTNWAAHRPELAGTGGPFRWLWLGLGLAVLLVFLAEMATFRAPGGSVVRMALTVWVVGYLAVL